jgi:hypothetical protein
MFRRLVALTLVLAGLAAARADAQAPRTLLPGNGNPAVSMPRDPLPPESRLPKVHWVGSPGDKWPFPVPSWWNDLVPVPGDPPRLILYTGSAGDKWAFPVAASSIDEAWLRARWPGLYEPERFPRR